MDIITFLLHLVGLTFVFTYDDLAYRKIATQSQTYPGGYMYYDANNAVDGNTTTCTKTTEVGIFNPHNSVWWKVDLGRVYSIYSINILFKNYDGYGYRQRGRFAGFSLYVSTTGDIQGSTLCYKDGPQLPPLNFTTTCTGQGRYVIFYNDRLDGVTYPDGYEIQNVFTELCEVIVQGCNKSGVYGENCNIPCPINCKDSICNIQNRSCIGCKSGWTGQTCSTKCIEGWYGVNCSQQCKGHCRGGTTCNHVTGLCERGCADGWTGSMCEKGIHED